MSTPVIVRVPATSGNLGPGFDCFGLALALFNRVTLVHSERAEVVVRGEGASELSGQADNLASRTIRRFYDVIGRPHPRLRLVLENEIPLARGLGSSAAAIIGSLVGANELAGCPLPADSLLSIAVDLEGHPDNVAAALLGGLTICVNTQNGAALPYVRVPVPAVLRAVVFIPEFRVSTQRARALLPASVSRDDAVYNVGRASLLVAGIFSGRLDVLRVATQDRLHQPYREALFPAAKQLFAVALEAGALGVFLSGAGPTILALTGSAPDEVARAFGEASRRTGIAGKALVLDIASGGAAVIRG